MVFRNLGSGILALIETNGKDKIERIEFMLSDEIGVVISLNQEQVEILTEEINQITNPINKGVLFFG